MFKLLVKGKALCTCKYWEDLVEFIEEFKKLNPNYADRRDFTIMVTGSTEKFYTWNKK